MRIGSHIVNFDWLGGGEKIGVTLSQIGRTEYKIDKTMFRMNSNISFPQDVIARDF